MTGTLRTDADGHLLCPTCSSEWTHVDFAYVSARREDQDFNEITVNAVSGQVQTHGEVPAPAGADGPGRRQRIALAGFCENGGHTFALVFTQHKGVTFVETVSPITHPADGDPAPGMDAIAGDPF